MNTEWALIDVLKNEYNARLLSYTVGNPSYKDGYIETASGIAPVMITPTIGLRQITLKIDFEGRTRNEIAMNISSFNKRIYEGGDILLPDNFYYYCAFDSASTPAEKAPWILQSDYSLSGYRHGAEISVQMSSSGVLDVMGNKEPEAVLTIEISKSPVTVCGITITGLTGTVIVDGINKTVTRYGENVFQYTDITQFPMLELGENNIQIDGNCTVGISYYPLYY